MRWEILDKAWKLARDKFPDVEKLYVNLPSKFSATGKCTIYDLGASNAVLGAVAYSGTVDDGIPSISVQLDNNEEKIATGRRNRQFRAAIAFLPSQKAASTIDIELMRKNCRDGFELGQKLAYLFANGRQIGTIVSGEISDWLSTYKATSLIVPVRTALETMGFREEDSNSGFNLCAANGKQKYILRQRVRVVHLTSIEYQECGIILESKGNAKDGFWYAVLVDGSEAPLWFPEGSLDEDEAGAIVDSGVNK